MNTHALPMRPATLADAEPVAACVAAAYWHYIPIIGRTPGPMLDDYAQIIAQHTVWVMEDDNAIVGLIVLMQKEYGMLLDNVAIHPTYQGRGLGKRLMQWAEKEVVRRGFEAIHLYTHEKMTQNINIYSKMGYLETERRHEYGFNRVYMRKCLIKSVSGLADR